MPTLEIARVVFCKRAPYFRHLLHSLVVQPIEGMGTAATTENLIFLYDPAWFAKLPDEEGAGVLMHELSHVYREHGKRIRISSFDPQVANIAADLAINDELLEAGWSLPSYALRCDKYGLPKNLTMEEYYELLQKKGGGNPDKQQRSGGKSKKTEPDGGPQVGSGGCGSCAGNKHAKEDDASSTLRDKSAGQEQGRPPAEVEQIVKQAAQDLKEHVRNRGTAPSSLIELCDKILAPPKVPWETRLRGITTSIMGQKIAGGSDYSRTRLSRRSIIRRRPISGLVDYKPTVAIVLDTSSSMGKKQLLAAIREVTGVLHGAGVTQAWFIEADSRVAAPPRQISVSHIRKGIEIHGRGGTDFLDGLLTADGLRPHPDIIVYFTDADGPVPPKNPTKSTVIWAIVPSPCRVELPPWGHVVEIDE